VAFEKYTSGEIGQKELETIYLTLRQWSAMRDEIINLLDTYTDRLNNANEGNFYTEYT